ncbi:MAG: rod shape-determining protein RodA [Brevinematia bacterium]
MRVPFDRVLLSVVFILVLIGLLNMYSASYYLDRSIFVKQVIWVILGIALMLVITFTNYEVLVNNALVFYIGFLILTLLTLFVGKEIRGTKSWFSILGMGIQPSEFLKFGILLLVAKFLSREKLDLSKFSVFAILGLIFFVPVIVVMLQPDLGMAISYILFFLLFSVVIGVNKNYLLLFLFLIFSLSFFPFFNAYVDYLLKMGVIEDTSKTIKVLLSKDFAAAFLVSSFVFFFIAWFVSRVSRDKFRFWSGVLLVIFAIGILGGNLVYNKLKPYQKNRIMVFFSPEVDRLGSGYNVIQSEIAVGSGGITGKGFMKGSQNKLNILPERTTDFAFSVLAEEWGFIGVIIVITLYIIMFFRFFWLIGTTEDMKSYVIVSGSMIIIFINFTINMLMVLGLAPVTGLPLPFISYGGSSMITNMALIGLVNSFYRERFKLI